ncbi:hypothetical protein DSOL_2412 [Desulfosporosinus metallidurans]|uniref:Uncharacterized protein n=1 Tax=Desulfosporosinus metallidurans TaxID=1888891 RepID=A0A1Q8QWK2_9FIRM|nr:hypothetical protein DSOL_2412 [Desulfosporosinus metallidurans]
MALRPCLLTGLPLARIIQLLFIKGRVVPIPIWLFNIKHSVQAALFHVGFSNKI